MFRTVSAPIKKANDNAIALKLLMPMQYPAKEPAARDIRRRRSGTMFAPLFVLPGLDLCNYRFDFCNHENNKPGNFDETIKRIAVTHNMKEFLHKQSAVTK